MPHEVRGVVARAKGQPVSVETVVVPDPGPDEAIVDVQACGVCHEVVPGLVEVEVAVPRPHRP
jgi:Zn-dependent alcohol dehydrogenase